MPRGYALDRCWIARPTALCETCRWFVEDTHPEYPTFGLDAGERCSSKQKYYHSMHPCKTPGRADGGATPQGGGNGLYIGAREATMSTLATAPAAALVADAAPLPASQRRRSSRREASSSNQLTPAPHSRTPSASLAALAEPATKRQRKRTDFLSPVEDPARGVDDPESEIAAPQSRKTGAAAAAGSTTPATARKRAPPTTELPKVRGSTSAAADTDLAGLRRADFPDFPWTGPPDRVARVALQIGLVEELQNLPANTPIGYIYSSCGNYSTEWALQKLQLTGDSGLPLLKLFRDSLGFLSKPNAKQRQNKSAVLAAIKSLRSKLCLGSGASLLREVYWRYFIAECDADPTVRPEKRHAGTQLVRTSDISRRKNFRLARLRPRWRQRSRGRGGADGRGVRCSVAEMYATVCARLVCIAVTRCTDCADCAGVSRVPSCAGRKAPAASMVGMVLGSETKGWNVVGHRAPAGSRP